MRVPDQVRALPRRSCARCVHLRPDWVCEIYSERIDQPVRAASDCPTYDDVDLVRAPAASAPGGIFARITTVDGWLLGERVLLDRDVHTEGDYDVGVAVAWLDTHPEDEVRVYLYDGDSGVCLKTIVMTGADHRA